MNSIAQSIGSFFLDMIETVTMALSIWLLCYLFLFMPTKVIGASMEPNFHTEDCVITSKISYRFGSPKRGDVVPIHAPPAANCAPGTGCEFFKRIIGLPGETVEVKECHYYINGTQLNEPYIPATTCTLPGPTIQSQLKLQSNQYFVSGDNREHSSDSRIWGPITREDIIGKAVFRWCPAATAGVL